MQTKMYKDRSVSYAMHIRLGRPLQNVCVLSLHFKTGFIRFIGFVIKSIHQGCQIKLSNTKLMFVHQSINSSALQLEYNAVNKMIGHYTKFLFSMSLNHIVSSK